MAMSKATAGLNNQPFNRSGSGRSFNPLFMDFNFSTKTGAFRLTFQDILDRFNKARDADGVNYTNRVACGDWRENPEIALYDFIRVELGAFPATMAEFNTLVECFIVAMEGGDPSAWFRTDHEAGFKNHIQELEEYRSEEATVIPGHAVNFYVRWYQRRDRALEDLSFFLGRR
jgi:hypothetical protein